MSPTLKLAQALIGHPSVTPDDHGCQAAIAEQLLPLGFNVENMRFGAVDNLWARHGDQGPLLVFAGHTDVVPAGPLGGWDTDPFAPTLMDGYLYGRGAADMKGSLAAMVTACVRFLAAYPQHNGTLALLITSDEEGDAVDGTVRVMETLESRQEKFSWCVVGEPTSTEQVGDVVKNGRRGSLGGRLIVKGTQGHVAYPHLADNPIHRAAPLIAALTSSIWDQGNAHFPPTTFQISNIHAGTGATNVIPGDLTIDFNFRYSTETSHIELIQRVTALIQAQGFDYELDWRHSGSPFLTAKGELLEAVSDAVASVTGKPPEFSTSGGTSDGRFIAPTGAQVVELGPVNATIHKTNECVRVEDLEKLSAMYEQIMINLLT